LLPDNIKEHLQCRKQVPVKKIRILVDIDDVLNNLLECWVKLLNQRYNLNAKVEDSKVWNVQGIYPTLTMEEVYRPMYEDEVWGMLSPKPTSVETLKRMIDDGHDVVIVTASVYETIPVKMDWLFATYPFLSWRNVIVTRRKQLIRGDVLIDDGFHNLEGGEYFKILIDAPYNRDYNTKENGMVRVSTLEEAYDVIKEVFNSP
jgi:5'(3')-deoxyribonucleotidase